MNFIQARYGAEAIRRRRSTRADRQGILGYVFAGGLAIACAVAIHQSWTAPEFELAHPDLKTFSRRSLSDIFKTESDECEGYPEAWAAWLFVIVLYSFVGLAVITDEYFEPTLTLLSEDFGLSRDVAGATFMAMGSSAPELITSFVDTFLSKASVGIGTILGSAMFNMLIIVAGSAIIGRRSSGAPLLINSWPIGRDATFYLISIAVLAGVMLNDGLLCVYKDNEFEIFVNASDTSVTEDDLYCYVGLIRPVEGFFLVLIYIIYIIFMVFNRRLHEFWDKKVSFQCCSRWCKPLSATRPAYELSGLEETMAKEQALQAQRDANRGIVPAQPTMPEDEDVPRARGHTDIDEFVGVDEEEGFPGRPWDMPESFGGKLYRIIAFPYYLIFWLMMPVSFPWRITRSVVLFLGCIFFITLLTFAMVYTATFGSCLINVDPFIIAYILLAIGTSVPDALASFIVARDGHGDMAVSNALGSNVFDILIGLGLPWFIGGLVFNEQVTWGDQHFGGSFVINNGGVFGLILLVGALFLFVVSLIVFRWRLHSFIAWILIAYYIAFVAVLILANACKIPICLELDCSRCGFEPSLI
mmetsp:Transcript_13701/g.26517  ORF Transcript_13701/g.26517 Transcript_13701/m.26517 type:complete len:585 (-) Transcript_13701:43-1797(-)